MENNVYKIQQPKNVKLKQFLLVLTTLVKIIVVFMHVIGMEQNVKHLHVQLFHKKLVIYIFHMT